jgi:hypothetical protein
MTQSAVRLSLDTITDLDDATLAELDEAVPVPIADEYSIDLTEPQRGTDEPDDRPPFDLEVVKPRAVDIRKLWALTGQDVPAEIQSAVGARVPILLHQGLTPFHPAGAPKRRVWGLGYEIRVNDLDAATVSLAPPSRSYEIGRLEQKTQLGLGIGGALAVPEAALKAVAEIPGVTLEGARLQITNDSQFRIGIELSLSVLEVQAGPVGAGGARWNFYAGRERLDTFHPLLHTLLVPAGTQELSVSVKTWVRRRARWLGLVSARQWTSPDVPFHVSLEGLGA